MGRPGFTVAAVVLWDAAGRVLAVRKAGTYAFMLPGGKIEPGETSAVTAARELAEEVGVRLDAGALVFLGAFRTDAANEPGHYVQADVYVHPDPVPGASPCAEIAELRWVDPRTAPAGDLGPLLVDLLPLLAGGAEPWRLHSP